MHIVASFREIYHGSVWNTDPWLLAPMFKLSDGISVYLRDFVYVNLADLGTAIGVVVKFFQEVSNKFIPLGMLRFTNYIGFFEFF